MKKARAKVATGAAEKLIYKLHAQQGWLERDQEKWEPVLRPDHAENREHDQEKWEPVLRERDKATKPARRTKEFVLCLPGGRVPKRKWRFDEVLVKKCLAHGWLRRKGQRFILSEEGNAFVRRLASGSDAYRGQHQLRRHKKVEVSPGVERPVIVNDAESPLGWLKKRKDKNGAPLISVQQFEAGERLARDFYLAHLSPKLTADWSAISSSRRQKRSAPGVGAEISLKALGARERVMTALQIVGPELAGILLDVCCFSQGLEAAERLAGWPQRSGKVVLQIALTRLARHYGLLNDDDASRPIRRRIEHWGARGYRPEIK